MKNNKNKKDCNRNMIDNKNYKKNNSKNYQSNSKKNKKNKKN